MKIINKLALVTVMLLGILLLPLAADKGFTQCGNSTYQCGVPEGNSQYVSGYTPQAEVIPTEASYTEVIPTMGPVQGGTWWHKSHRWGNWRENRVDYGKSWNWNNTHDWNNRYDWNNRHTYGFPNGNGCSGYGCRPTGYNGMNGRRVYPSGNGYNGDRTSPYINYAQQHARQPYGNGSSDPGGFNRSPYWSYATNGGRGAYDGPPAFNYSGKYDNPPTPEELRRHGSYDILPESYSKLNGRYDNPPTPAELSSHGSYDSIPAEQTKIGSYDETPSTQSSFGSYN